MRLFERIFVGFFVYVAILSLFFHDRPLMRAQPFVYPVAASALFLLLSKCERGPWKRAIVIARDWLPIFVLLVAFREMELFSPASYDLRFEKQWIGLDKLVLHDWGLRKAIESIGVIGPFYLEFCYLVVYGVAAYSLVWIAWLRSRRAIDYFWAVYLAGTLGAYALFPFFPSLPPRYAFAMVEAPSVTTWVRAFNWTILKGATIHSGVFPSAHVSSAFSAAWALYFVLPGRRWVAHGMLAYAVSVSLATVYGRYHYVADVLGGFAVSLIALAIAFAMRGYVQKHQSVEAA